MKVGDELEQRPPFRFEAIHGTPVWIVAIRFSKVSERPRKLSHRYKWRSISESNEIMSRMSPLVGVRHLFVTLPIWHFLHPIHLSNPNELKFFDAGNAVWSSIKSKTSNCCMPLYSIFSLFQLNCIFRIKQHSSRFDLTLVIFAASHRVST